MDIWQGSEYALISGYIRVLNILGFWICQGYTRFWIKYFVTDVCKYSEYALDSDYATVLNMLGSHKIVNKIFHHKYLTRFRICLQFWKYQCYAGFCRKQPVIHVWQVSEYSLDSQSYRAWIYMVVSMPRLHMVLHKLYFKDSRYFECLEFWIY